MKTDPGLGLGWWTARRVRKATGADAILWIVLLAIAACVVISGRRARAVLKPRSAVEVARFLDDLEVPVRLPDAVLTDSAGLRVTLLSRIQRHRAVVSFYAPWCGPCQKELPAIYKRLGPRTDFIIVLSANEDVEDTRRQLSNLGLADVGFFVDVTGELEREARVKVLPTTFLVTRAGGVLAHERGFSEFALIRLEQRAQRSEEP